MASSSNKHLDPGLLLAAITIIFLAVTLGPGFMNDEAQVVNIDGMPFPGTVNIAGSKQSLIGGGTRRKWGFQVYAVGIFSDMNLIKNMKKKYEGPVKGTKFSSDFSGSKQARTLLLRFHREVASSDVAEALGEALVDKVGKETSSKFESFILGVIQKQGKKVVEKGSDIFITCRGEKVWASLVEGKDASTMSSKGLCSAIFMVYLGNKPVSAQAKEGFEQSFADLVVS